MSKTRISCAVVGLGVGEQHARSILAHPQLNLNYIVEHDEKKALAFIQEQALPETRVCSYQDLINDDELQLISIASFDDDHYEQVMEGLKKNKHLFIEKPLCQNRAQLMNIFDRWKKSSSYITSNLVLRNAPLYISIQEMIKDGRFGEIYAFDGDYLYGRVHKITSGWRKEIKNYSVMEGGGIHIIDLMLFLTDQKPTAVQSYKNKIVTRETEFKYHDFHAATFTFSSGLIGRITANFGCVHPHQHYIRIFGTKATFIHDDQGARIMWHRDNEKQPAEKLHLDAKPKEKGALIHKFIDKIFQKERNSLAYREFDLMNIVLAADEALESNTETKINYFE